MALTRKMLKAMGIEDEKIDQIVEAHAETVDALKKQCEELKEKADGYEGVQKELNELKTANKSSEDWKAKFEKLQADVDGEKQQTAVTNAYKKLLRESGVDARLIDLVVKGSDLSKIKLDKDGGIEGAKELGDKIKTDLADFIPAHEEIKTIPKTPPKTEPVKMSKSDIMAIKDTSARQKAIAENLDAFGGGSSSD